jgi:hypothetical protein
MTRNVNECIRILESCTIEIVFYCSKEFYFAREKKLSDRR